MMLFPTTNKYFLYFTKKRNVYKFVSYIFNLSGIFMNFNMDNPINQKTKHCISIKIVKILTITICILQLNACASIYLKLGSKSKKSLLIYTCIFVTYFIFRFYLCKSSFILNKIIKNVCYISNNINGKIYIPRWTYVWIIIVLISVIFLFIYMGLELYNNNDLLKSIMFGHSIKSVYMKLFFSFLYSLFYTLILFMPLNAFDFYYVMNCLYIASLFKKLCKMLKNSSNPDYKYLTHIYNNITTVAEILDKKVGFLVFVSILYNAFSMYFGLTIVIHHNDNKDEPQQYVMIFVCILGFLSFIAKVESASLISTSSLSCKKESRKIYEFNYKQVFNYIRLTKNFKEFYMTVWGFIEIKRSIILGTLGAILTYSLLVDNLLEI